MKRINAKLLLFGVLAFGIALVSYQIPGGLSFAQQQQQQEVEYSCPMHPEGKSKKPGSCPKCGMTLKQVSKPDPQAQAEEEAQWSGTHYPNVELVTQDGKKGHFHDDLIKGKVVVLELIYPTCKYNCP